MVLNGFHLSGKIALAMHAASDRSIDAGAHLEKDAWPSCRQGGPVYAGPSAGHIQMPALDVAVYGLAGCFC